MDEKQKEDLDFLRKYAKLLDSQFTIPGTNFSFGIDPLIGLIPGLGSFSGLITGLVLVYLSRHHNVSLKTQIMMIRNLLVDFVFGLVPVLGNIKDFFYKANNKNIKLIEDNLVHEKNNGSPVILIFTTAFSILFFVLVLIVVIIFGIKFLLTLI